MRCVCGKKVPPSCAPCNYCTTTFCWSCRMPEKHKCTAFTQQKYVERHPYDVIVNSLPKQPLL